MTARHFGTKAALTELGGGDYNLGLQVAENDRKIWKSSGSRYKAKTSTYPAEVAWIKKWYSDRYKLDEHGTDDRPPGLIG